MAAGETEAAVAGGREAAVAAGEAGFCRCGRTQSGKGTGPGVQP